MKVREFILEKMKNENLSQSAFSRKTGISQALVSKIILDNHNLTINTIRKIAGSWGENISCLLGEGPCRTLNNKMQKGLSSRG